MSPGRLHPDDVEAIAEALARHLAGILTPGDPDEWLTAREYARRRHLALSTVYAHADELGAQRIGGALRFPATPPATPDAATPPPRPRPRPARVDLLPIGRQA